MRVLTTYSGDVANVNITQLQDGLSLLPSPDSLGLADYLNSCELGFCFVSKLKPFVISNPHAHP